MTEERSPKKPEEEKRPREGVRISVVHGHDPVRNSKARMA